MTRQVQRDDSYCRQAIPPASSAMMSVFSDTPWRLASATSAACNSTGSLTRNWPECSGMGTERCGVIKARHLAFEVAVDAAKLEGVAPVGVCDVRDANGVAVDDDAEAFAFAEGDGFHTQHGTGCGTDLSRVGA
jgi:hypothetical protein